MITRLRHVLAPLAVPLGLVLLLVLCATEPPPWAVWLLVALVGFALLVAAWVAVWVAVHHWRARRPEPLQRAGGPR